jgi:sugar phosphate isomerase/epimerase
MKKGFQMFTVRDLLTEKKEALSVFKKLKSFGYESIHGYLTPLFTLEEYKSIVFESGLENCSSDGNFELMRRSYEAIKKAINSAEYLGVKQISIETMPKEYRETREGYEKFAREINKISREIKNAGFKLLYHPHAIEFFSLGGGLKGMDIILAETDPDGLWFCLDTHWLTAGGVSVIDWLKRVKGRMTIVHFKDYAITKAAVDRVEEVHKQFAEVGEGNLDWERIISVCKEIGIEHAVVEQDICRGNPIESLKKSIDNMMKYKV